MYVQERPGSPATYIIIAANVVIWLITVLITASAGRMYLWILYNFGAVPILIVNGINLHSLITHMFLHDTSSIWHIFLNMYMLFLFGRDVEQTLGTFRFLLVYFLSGLGGSFLHIFYFTSFFPTPSTTEELVRCFQLSQPPCVPSIGASGAIFGLMATYAVLFPFRRLFLLWGFFLPIAAPAIAVILVLALIQTLFMLATPFSSIAYTAHVGGFITGLIMALLFRATYLRRRIYWEW